MLLRGSRNNIRQVNLFENCSSMLSKQLPMRILMIASSFPKYPGETTAPFIEEIAAGVAARGHTVTLLAPWHPEIRRAPVERGVNLHFFHYAPHPALNVWGYAQSLISDTHIRSQTLAATPFALSASLHALSSELLAARQQQAPYDLVQAHWALPNGPPAALVARTFGLPLVVSLHGSDIYLAERHWSLAAGAAFALRSAAFVTACSSDLRQRSLRLGAHPSRSCVVPYGVDTDQFHPDPEAPHTIRAELGLPADSAIVLGLGRLVSKKGFGVLLDAWPGILARHPQATLVIVGYGDLREPLEHQAATLGISERVCFTGQLERRRTAAYLAGADVFALPIVREGVDGLPNVLLEAMGAGRAIVASRVAGVPDVIDHGVHGLIVPERDPAALTESITQLLDNRELANRLGSAARERIMHELGWEHNAAHFEQVFLQALARGRAAMSR
jgi:glycosyltransferase involved in cell wall biosynthesis